MVNDKNQRLKRYEEILRLMADGVSMKDACKEKDIKLDTFYQWNRRRQADKGAKIVHHDVVSLTPNGERYLKHKDEKNNELFLFIEFLEAQIKMYKKMRGL